MVPRRPSPRRDDRPVDLHGIVLPDARSGDPVDLGGLGLGLGLGAGAVPAVLTAIRHRF